MNLQGSDVRRLKVIFIVEFAKEPPALSAR